MRTDVSGIYGGHASGHGSCNSNKYYNEAKSYRPIALLDTLGKALEKIVAKQLAQLAEEHHMLPDQQMGARQQRDITTTLELLTEQIHTVWARGTGTKQWIASMLCLDMAGDFDNASHKRLIPFLKLPQTYCVLLAP
jgi:hypothetical protein